MKSLAGTEVEGTVVSIVRKFLFVRPDNKAVGSEVFAHIDNCANPECLGIGDQAQANRRQPTGNLKIGDRISMTLIEGTEDSRNREREYAAEPWRVLVEEAQTDETPGVRSDDPFMPDIHFPDPPNEEPQVVDVIEPVKETPSAEAPSEEVMRTPVADSRAKSNFRPLTAGGPDEVKWARGAYQSVLESLEDPPPEDPSADGPKEEDTPDQAEAPTNRDITSVVHPDEDRYREIGPIPQDFSRETVDSQQTPIPPDFTPSADDLGPPDLDKKGLLKKFFGKLLGG